MAEPSGERIRPSDEPVFPGEADSVSLEEVRARALRHNPGLTGLAWEAAARESRARQSGRLPNPVLGVLVEDVGASGPSGTPGSALGIQPQTTVQIGQLIELGRKRGLRRDLSGAERDLAGWDYAAARLDLLTRVQHAFVDVVTGQDHVALTERALQLVEQVYQRARDRVAAGAVSPIEETRAAVAVAAARAEAHRALRELAAARSGLAALWGATEARFAGASGTLDVPAEVPPFDALAGRLEENPDVARGAVEVLRQRIALSAEVAQRVPDLTLTGGVRRFPDLGSSALVLGGSLALPLFDRNSDGIDAAKSRVERALQEKRAARVRAAADLADAYAALSASHQEALILRETAVPGAERAFAAVSEGYRLGRFGYLDVLEAQRTLIATSNQYLQALAGYRKAVANLERIIGGPLEAVSAPLR